MEAELSCTYVCVCDARMKISPPDALLTTWMPVNLNWKLFFGKISLVEGVVVIFHRPRGLVRSCVRRASSSIIWYKMKLSKGSFGAPHLGATQKILLINAMGHITCKWSVLDRIELPALNAPFRDNRGGGGGGLISKGCAHPRSHPVSIPFSSRSHTPSIRDKPLYPTYYQSGTTQARHSARSMH